MNKIYSLFLVLLALSNHARADDHDHAKEGKHEETKEEDSRFGPKKGVLAASEELGFKLNEAAVRNFKIVTEALPKNGPWRVPRKAIAFSKAETHVFLEKDRYFKSADVKILKRDRDYVVIESKDLQGGEKIAVQGAAFLTIVNEAVFGEELSHEH